MLKHAYFNSVLQGVSDAHVLSLPIGAKDAAAKLKVVA